MKGDFLGLGEKRVPKGERWLGFMLFGILEYAVLDAVRYGEFMTQNGWRLKR